MSETVLECSRNPLIQEDVEKIAEAVPLLQSGNWSELMDKYLEVDDDG